MIKLTAIALSITLSILLLSSSYWFENEQLKIEKINKKHLEDIRKLKKIAQINNWLDKVVKPMLKVTPDSVDLADENLVKYFDKHEKELKFEVAKYIYSDDVAKNLLLKYEVDRKKLNKLKKLMRLKYREGFLQFQELNMDKKVIKGTILLVQPFNGEHNVSK